MLYANNKRNRLGNGGFADNSIREVDGNFRVNKETRTAIAGFSGLARIRYHPQRCMHFRVLPVDGTFYPCRPLQRYIFDPPENRFEVKGYKLFIKEYNYIRKLFVIGYKNG
jgi:hypothetical protein